MHKKKADMVDSNFNIPMLTVVKLLCMLADWQGWQGCLRSMARPICHCGRR